MVEARNNQAATRSQESSRQIFYPTTMQELFTAWDHFPTAVLYAGGTSQSFHRENGYKISLPPYIISLCGPDELQRFSRTERYLEIGAMVRLNEIINMGKIVPAAFTRALSEIAGPQLRNLATIGGHICYPAKQLDAAAPLIALDARYELRTSSSARWISASRFSLVPGLPPVNAQELLTRIRIPLEVWNYSSYKKFTDPHTGDDTAGSMVFLARFQKNILTDIRLVYAGRLVIRDKNSESFLTGKELPLDQRDVAHFIGLWKTCLSAIEPSRNPGDERAATENLNALMRAKMLNFIESCIRDLAD